MKKIFIIFALILSLSLITSAQNSLIGEAKKSISGLTMTVDSYNKAFNKFKPALTHEETSNRAETWALANRIKIELFDKDKYEELSAIEPDVRICMACGSCTAVCTAGKFSVTSLREAIEDIKNARPENALEMLHACQLCGKCSMVCPRGINTRHLILSMTKVYSTQ